MADFSVSDVASKIKAPEGISLGDMMNMAIGAQKFKQAQQINPLLLREEEAKTTEAEETLQPKITQKKAESETAVYGANTAKLKNIIDASTNGVQQIQQLHNDPKLSYDKVVKMVTDTINNSSHYLNPEDKQSAVNQALIGLNPNATATEIKAFLAQKQASALSAQAQAEKLYPTAYMQDTGQTITPVAGGNPLLTGMNPSQPVGTPITKQLPTGTERVITDPTEAARMGVPVGTKILIGGGGGQGGKGGPAPAVSSMQPGQAESYQARSKVAAEDWSQTTQDATSAAKNIGLYQKLKEYSKGASTGAFAHPREFLNNVAQTLSIKNDETATDTQLLDKISAQLALQGGKNGTDFATTIRQAADPNKHMTLQAIEQASNQYIGQEKLKLVKQAVMQQYQTDPEKYTKALTQFSQIADPNVLQWSSMSVEDKKRFKSSMTEPEQTAFSKKLHALEVLNNKYNLGLM